MHQGQLGTMQFISKIRFLEFKVDSDNQEGTHNYVTDSVTFILWEHKN